MFLKVLFTKSEKSSSNIKHGSQVCYDVSVDRVMSRCTDQDLSAANKRQTRH